jgi:hypothetical protein
VIELKTASVPRTAWLPIQQMLATLVESALRLQKWFFCWFFSTAAAVAAEKNQG